MPNSAGVVGPDYITPIDIDGAAAVHADAAQAVVDLGLVTDTSETFTPDPAGIVGPDYVIPVEADISVGGLADAMADQGILEDSETSPPTVVGPDYQAPVSVAFSTITEAQFVTAMAEAGYFNDTSA